MKFLDNIFDKFIYWFDPPETEQQRESRIRFLQGLAPVHMGTISPAVSGTGSFASPQPPEPFPPPRPLKEMSQRELESVVSKYVASLFKDNEPTVESERLRYAVYRIGAFQYGSFDAGFRRYDSLVGDLDAVYESSIILTNFVERQTETCPDVVNDVGLLEFRRAALYLITMANRTYVSVIAQESLRKPEMICPASLSCWTYLDLAGKEAA